MQSESEKWPCTRKVCLVFHCWSGKTNSDEYKFYVLDCASSPGGAANEYPYMAPTMLFKQTSPPVAFCVLNSTLYMFEGLHPFLNRRGDEDKSAWKFEMTPQILAGSNCNLERDKNLVSIKPMQHKKFFPRALPTPDGKRILVFPSEMFWDWAEGEYCGGRLELYDVDNDSWESLPPIPRCPCKPTPCNLQIKSYGFENDSHFVMQTQCGAPLALNLKSNEWEDEPLHYQVRGADDHFLGIGDFYFTPYCAYDVRDLGEFQFPYLSSFQHRLEPYITLLGHPKHGCYDMCIVQTRRFPYRRLRRTNNNLCVVLDIYRTDVEKFKTQVEKYKTEPKMTLKDMLLLDKDKGQVICSDEDEGEEDMFFDQEEEEEEGEKEQDMSSEGEEDEEEEPEREELVVVSTNQPLRDSTSVIQTIKLRIDFDFFTYFSGDMYAFSV